MMGIRNVFVAKVDNSEESSTRASLAQSSFSSQLRSWFHYLKHYPASTKTYSEKPRHAKQILVRLRSYGSMRFSFKIVEIPELSPSTPPPIPPIHKLPTELLLDIFLRCCDNKLRLPSMNRILSTDNTKTNLLQVCSRWRSILLSTTHLWTSLDIYLRNKSRKRRQVHDAQLLDMWLSYSGDKLIDISLSTLPKYLEATMTSHISRCKSLSLQKSQNLLEIALQQPLPNLESLWISRGDFSGHGLPSYTQGLPQWEKLQSIIWHCSTLPFVLADVPMPNLKGLHLMCPVSGDQCRNILTSCPELRLLNLSGGIIEVSDDVEPVTHRSIFHLTLRSDADPLALLACFTLPGLQQLHLAGSGDTSTRSHESFIRFLQRSSCLLTSFYITEEERPVDHFLTFLGNPLLQSVTNLALSTAKDGGVSEETIQCLVFPLPGLNTGLFPGLKRLSISVDPQNVPDGMFTDMIASRANPNDVAAAPAERLVNVTVSTKRRRLLSVSDKLWGQRDQTALVSLREKGLELWVY